MTSGFDQGAFDDALDRIETCLGYLKGNELAWQTFHEYGLGTIEMPPALGEFSYSTPCPDGRFKVEYWKYPSIDTQAGWDSSPENIKAQVDGLKQAMDTAWRFGPSWANGVAGQMRDVCAQFTEPFVPTMTGAIEMMQARVVSQLELSVNDDWLELGGAAADWDGRFANNFRIFYDNYNDVVSRFGVFTGWINLGFSLAARLIAGAQQGAGKTADSLRKNLESQLDHWVHDGGDQPNEPGEWPPWVGDMASLVGSTLDLAGKIPIVGEVNELRGLYSQTTAVMQDIDDLTGSNLMPDKKAFAQVQRADEIYECLQTSMYDEYYLNYRAGMDQIDAGGAGEGYVENSFSAQGLLGLMDDVGSQFGLRPVPATNLN
ncbi:hypothetical protein [Nocardioides sp. 1609]|uniref:hypothetical protein n=1 Tax=Nocardioides sp. 1609 TaxID=2508327 RepID=UPI0010701471|nr:hypothetical protein [Nocardioides sp. 1609]